MDMKFDLLQYAGKHTPKAYENRVLKIFGPKSQEVKEDLRKSHNEYLHNLYSSDTIKVIKSWRMIWARHGAR
jgi:hypothetical protein